jgi:hypothetical protein
MQMITADNSAQYQIEEFALFFIALVFVAVVAAVSTAAMWTCGPRYRVKSYAFTWMKSSLRVECWLK